MVIFLKAFWSFQLWKKLYPFSRILWGNEKIFDVNFLEKLFQTFSFDKIVISIKMLWVYASFYAKSFIDSNFSESFLNIKASKKNVNSSDMLWVMQKPSSIVVWREAFWTFQLQKMCNISFECCDFLQEVSL